ncbi:MAG: outer membrane beta-barrel protein [Bacteroidota bacterium]|nr:outer membrane beta-barrel protein [Bacteroidota bacterium]
MRKLLLLSFLLCLPYFADAQYKPGKRRKNSNSFTNKRNKPRKEFILGIGASNFLGELGGANQIGTNFIKDLEFSATRTSFAFGMRYKFKKRFAVSGGFHYLMLSGSDKLTKEPFRSNRNLSFRAPIFEASIQAEFFFTKEQQGHLYKIKNAKGMKNYDFQGYLFVGFGGFYFNPKAQYKGNWVALQPLGTEGQGLPGNKKKYSRVSICIPYGIGAKYAINKDWAVGLEIGIRKTFTDYIDDVSTVYYDNSELYQERGIEAATLADPSLANYPESLGGDATGYNQTAAGQQRGDSRDKDSYAFLNVTISYKMPYKRRTRSKF